MKKMEPMFLSKVHLLSNITPRILKESHEIKEALSKKDQGEEEIYW